ncbi:unnamed protein product [Gongylonema pulchrum]|uniref:Transposase n=1 Tax=Gongylonema pulchrum TaxID=637853 RepID=A0A183CVL1_9BILA|nr:unnamed protein product [Gongylonema pulchrum]
MCPICATGTFSSVSQPYSMLAEQHGAGRVTFTIQKSDAHRMASTVILNRQLQRQHRLVRRILTACETT